jgi:stage V sporulation protein G
MVVTEVKIKLVPRSESKLLAFASITLDKCFVVRDIKIIQGNKALFVAMPSRKITDHCKKCSAKNHLQAQYCNQCGSQLPEKRTRPDGRGRAKLHADIAHPINARCRQDIQDSILKAYSEELARSQLPGYVPPVFDEFDAGPDDEEVGVAGAAAESAAGNGNSAPEDPLDAQPPPSWKPSKPDNKIEDAGGFGILS